MSWHFCQYFLAKFLVLFLVTTVQFEVIFYKANCVVINRYDINAIAVNTDHKKITLELENGSTVVVPFDSGFREFKITTGRGYERTYLYDGSRLIRIKARVCNNT